MWPCISIGASWRCYNDGGVDSPGTVQALRSDQRSELFDRDSLWKMPCRFTMFYWWRYIPCIVSIYERLVGDVGAGRAILGESNSL